MIFTVALFDSLNSSFQVGNIREINENLKTLFAYEVKVCLCGKLCTQFFSTLLSSNRKTKLQKVVENNHNIPFVIISYVDHVLFLDCRHLEIALYMYLRLFAAL